MTLAELTAGLPLLETSGDLSRRITGIAYDSRQVGPGDLFVCIEGYVTDGHRYIPQAQAQGAAALLVQKRPEATAVPWVRVAKSRQALALVSDRFFGHPSGRLALTGVTGTKGKTTVTYMLQAILTAAGRKAGLIGTIATLMGETVRPAGRTTPESYDLQLLLNDMAAQGLDSCVMEVSSQGLMLDRVYGCSYQTAVFTNLHHDHIGPTEHASMADYFQAKLMLFDQSRQAVINRDIPQYEAVRAAARGPCISYGFHPEADVRAAKIRRLKDQGRSGTSFELSSPWYQGDIFVGLPGSFNISNALAAIACAGLAQLPLDAVRQALATVTVPGRVEPVPSRLPFQVLVDYAHNAASLALLLETLRDYVSGRLILVFGNGGDRARSRRFEMGDVAGRLADITLITSDNPRSEDPQAIIADIITGIRPTGGAYQVEVDRAKAIGQAVFMAQPGDLVVIAGKGHETYQIFKDRTIHFDDVEEASRFIRQREDQDHETAIL